MSFDFDRDNLKRYWDFVAERQRIYHRRVVMREQAPWTENHVLQTRFFTNMYRVLDPGTQFAVDFILKADISRGAKIFNLMLYRKVGKEETMRALGLTPDPWAWDQEGWLEVFDAATARGEAPWSSAYMVTSHGNMGFGNKPRNIGALIQIASDNWRNIEPKLVAAPDRRAFWMALSDLQGWGRFLAFQVLVDCSYPDFRAIPEGDPLNDSFMPVMPFDNNGWAACGPGAQDGMKRLLPSANERAEDSVLQALYRMQFDELERRKFCWLRSASGEPLPLHRADIQNTLCEFSKYDQYCQGPKSGKKRNFSPQEACRRDEAQRALELEVPEVEPPARPKRGRGFNDTAASLRGEAEALRDSQMEVL